MNIVPPELEKSYHRFLIGRGDAAGSLCSCIRGSFPEQASTGAWAALVLSRIYFVKGRLGLASAFLDIAFGLFRKREDRAVPLGLWVNRAAILKQCGRVEVAARILRRVLNLAMKKGQPVAAAKSALNLSVILARAEKREEASELIDFASTTYKTLRLYEYKPRIALASAFLELRSGNFGRAVDFAHSSVRGEGGPVDGRQRLTGLMICAECFLNLKEYGKASLMLEDAASMKTILESLRPMKIRWLTLKSSLERCRGNRVLASGLMDTAKLFDAESERSREPGLEAGFVDLSDGTVHQCANPGTDVFITGNRRLMAILDRIRNSAPFSLPILIEGETGTGKEIISRLIHRWSGCEAFPFIAVNMAALPGKLFESALFGHVKGAFTGAVKDSEGLVGSAGRGSLFLDEIGELPKELQPKLLRFLETGEYFPVGSTRAVRSEARVIAATNRDLLEESDRGVFRKDLYYRLAAVRYTIPPLRERPDDISLLAEHLLRRLEYLYGFSPLKLGIPACQALQCSDWPGNVRELWNELVSAALKRKQGTIRCSDLSSALLKKAFSPRKDNRPRPGLQGSGNDVESVLESGHKWRSIDEKLKSIERDEISVALSRSGGNQLKAAERLGLKRTTLIYRMRRCGLV